MTAAQSVIDFLAELAEVEVQLSASDGQLTIRAPKGVLTPDLRARISASKEALLGLLEQRGGELGMGALAPVVPDLQHRYEPFPLTDIQQAYWIGRSSVFDIGDVSIHLYSELDCVDLDIARLQRSWDRLVERHEMLRAVILPDGQQQILERVPPCQITVLDLRGAAPDEVEAQLQAQREELSHQVFRLDVWPSFELRVSLLDERRARLHSSVDLLHIDGGSLFVLNHEWVQLYHDPDVVLPPLVFSYRDYVLAEQALHESELYRRALAYWREQLATLPEAPQLPLARRPAALGAARFGRRSLRFDPLVWQRFKELATREFGLTPSVVLLGVYAEALATWSRDPAFTINVTLFNRLPFHAQVNDILGDFTSMVLMAVGQRGRMSFAEWTRRLQSQLWSHLEHRYVSGVVVLRELARYQRRSSGVSMPIVFTSILSLGAQGSGPPRSSSSAAIGELVYRITQTPQVWMDLQVFEEEGTLIAHFDAVESLFPPGVVDQIFDAFCATVHALTADVRLWGEAQRLVGVPTPQADVCAAMNATDVPLRGGTLPDLLAAQLSAHADQVAVVCGGHSLSYADLCQRAGDLGRRLCVLGVRPEMVVAVVMDKGWEQVVAVYGVLDSGAAYLPIDPGVPPDRLHFLLAQGGVTIAVTQPHIDAALVWPAQIRRLCVVEPSLAVALPAPFRCPEMLAYVLYTSGSTGQPKGAMIAHRSVFNRVVDVNRRFGVGPDDRVLALTALHHDLSVYDIFGTVAAGAALVLPDAERLRDPAHWCEVMCRERVTVWNSVPAFMEMFVEYLEHASNREGILPCSLRLVLLSGDWVPVTLPNRLRALLPGVRVVSLGGPTETTVWDICYPVDEVDAQWNSIPYGRPMDNARYYVLNDALELCPTWVPGELYIGGVGLARGYYDRPDLTAERFVPNPFVLGGGAESEVSGSFGSMGLEQSVFGSRLYRSGDMGHYLPDGTIEFLGRRDFQVKLAGQRIELGEIEATLLAHPGVRAAVAVMAGKDRQSHQLVVYVVPEQDADAGAGAVVPTRFPGSLQDPLARLEFKLARHGLRDVASAFPRLSLVRPDLDEVLRRAYGERRSQRRFPPTPLLFEQLNGLLNCLRLVEIDGQLRYRYASAGSLYPVQVYLHIQPGRVVGVAGGLYYYHPREHDLVLLAADAQIDRSVHVPTNQAMFDAAAFSIFLVGRLAAIEPIYGELARDFCLLEAGYMSQLLMSSATVCGVGMCPIGMVHFHALRDLFALGEGDILLHSHLCGPLDLSEAVSDDEVVQPPQRAPVFADELRALLQAKLPVHMASAAIVVREALPLTYNGKVDRKALIELAGVSAVAEVACVAPTNATEELLVQIIRDVTGIVDASTQTNFFDLGISSIAVVKVYNQIKQHLSTDLTITEVFRHPTIASLAERLGQGQTEQRASRRGQRRAEARQSAQRRHDQDGSYDG